MDTIIKSMSNGARSFAKNDDGSQVIEYALIIAVVSITLIVALRDITGTSFAGFIGRVATCLTTAASCV